MAEPKVFVTQFLPQLNYQKTEEYGSVIFLTEKEYRPEPTPPGFNDQVVNEITYKLTEYVPGIDYIVVTGSSMPNVLVGIWMAKHPGKHKILKWSNMRKAYDLHIINT